MVKKKSLQIALMILVVAGLTSCSRDYHFEYAGKYHPDIPSGQTTSANNEAKSQPAKISSLPAHQQQELMSASANEQIRFVKKEISPTVPVMSYPLTKEQTKRAAKFFDRVEKASSKHADQWITPGATSNTIHSMEKNTNRVAPASEEKLLYCLLGVLLPPLAVALWEDGITINFWLAILFTLLFWIPGVIFAWIIILST